MAAGLKDLFESIMGLGITVGARATEKGAKGALLSAAKKIGWASQGASVGGGIYSRSLHSHRLSGHSMSNGFAGRENVSNYDPANSYKSKMNADYDRGRLSGSGALSGSMKRIRDSQGQSEPLRRNAGGPAMGALCRYQTGAAQNGSNSAQNCVQPQFASSTFGVGNKRAAQTTSLKGRLKY